ncbi:MAG TPA: hypothetical protein VKC35_10060 [Vicinamibacterales bacterium]|nr:hypothetical protein [Vicinamibacterales bacterium]
MRRLFIVASLALVISAPALAQRGRGAGAGADASAAAAGKPTPRAADGHPDLNGVWAGSAEAVKALAPGESARILFPVRTNPDDKRIFDEMDRAAKERQAAEPNKPPYKPELASKVQLLSDKRQFNDPSFYCKPLGVPRMGPPSQVVQTPGLVVLLYQGRNTFRAIPTDGRAHNEDADWTWMGDSVGRWDGDTLVIDTTRLIEDSWLGADGWFHGPKMHVVERLGRRGDTLTWSATVDDPGVFTKPWEMTPRTMRLNANPKALLEEDPPCLEQDGPHIVTDDHH